MFDVRELNISIELWGVAFCAMGIASALLFPRTERRYRNLLALLFTAALVAAGGDALAGVYRGQPGETAWMATHVGNFATFVGNIAILPSFTLFLCTRLTDTTGRTYRRWIAFTWSAAVVMWILTALGVFYTIDDANVYSRTDLYWITYVYTLIICGVDLFLTLRHSSQFAGTELFSFLFFATSPIIAMGFQIVVYGLNLIIIVAVIGVAILFLETQAYSARALAARTEELARTRVEVAESRITAMVSQIQPHFLFNTLDSIYYLCAEDPAKAQLAIDRFSTYLRANVASLSKATPVPIETELEHVRIYLSLEQLSMEDLLTWEIDAQAVGFSVPALSLQTLAENAVKHGVGGRPEGGKVVVRTREAMDCWLASVEDDGVGFDTEAPVPEGHVGLENTRLRLAAMCGGELEVTSVPGRGTTAVMRIPKKGRS